MDLLLKLRSDKAADIREFFIQLWKDNTLYKSLLDQFGDHATILKECHKAHVTKFYDKEGNASFTPSGVSTYLNFAKNNCELELYVEIKNKICVLFQYYELLENGFYSDLQVVKEFFMSNPFYSEDIYMNAIDGFLREMIHNNPNDTIKRNLMHFMTTSMSSKNNEKIEFMFRILSVFTSYEIFLNLFIPWSKDKEEQIKRDPSFNKKIEKMLGTKIDNWIHFLEYPRRLKSREVEINENEIHVTG